MRKLVPIVDSFLLFLLVGGMLTACGGDDKEDPKPQSEATNTLVLELDHIGADGLRLASHHKYQNALGQTYQVDRMLYYLTNLQVKRADGTYWSEAASYHLINGIGTPNPTITLKVPYGNYTGLRVSFGVDSLANSRTDQVGDLNPGNGMAWDWSTGYRFMVLEGTYEESDSTNEPILYHPGRNRAYRVMNFTFPQTVTIGASRTANAHVTVRAGDVFGGPNRMDFTQPAQRSVMQNPAEVVRVADNIATIFQVDHIHN